MNLTELSYDQLNYEKGFFIVNLSLRYSERPIAALVQMKFGKAFHFLKIIE